MRVDRRGARINKTRYLAEHGRWGEARMAGMEKLDRDRYFRASGGDGSAAGGASKMYSAEALSGHVTKYKDDIFETNKDLWLDSGKLDAPAHGNTITYRDAIYPVTEPVQDFLNGVFCQGILSIAERYWKATFQDMSDASGIRRRPSSRRPVLGNPVEREAVHAALSFKRNGTATNPWEHARFKALYDGRLYFSQQLHAFRLLATCAFQDATFVASRSYNANAVKEPTRSGNVCSMAVEDGIIAISSMVGSSIETHLFFESTNHAVPFIFGANVGVNEAKIRSSGWRAILDVFYSSYSNLYSTYWIKLVTDDRSSTQITDAGRTRYTSASDLALRYAHTNIGGKGKPVTVVYTNGKLSEIAPSNRTFTLEHVPPGFRGFPNVETLFKGKTMIHNEYARYCDPHAKVNFDSPVDSVIHKSIQLLGLVHTILPNLSKEPARFSRSMAAAAQRLNSDEDQLLGIMTLMRSLQVDGEFERYFKVPVRRKRHPTQYRTVIADNQKYVDNWVTPNLPTSSIVPAPRII